MKDQRHGKAPWNAGEGYPNYRGGNKSIRIEKNYRNCIEINEYMNRYVSYAKAYLAMIEKNAELDPDMFLRGKSFYHSIGVSIRSVRNRSNEGEATEIIKSIDYIHEELDIPYDEIAVVMNNGRYKKQLYGWKDKTYDVESALTKLIDLKDIPFSYERSLSNEKKAIAEAETIDDVNKLCMEEQEPEDFFSDQCGIEMGESDEMAEIDFISKLSMFINQKKAQTKYKALNINEKLTGEQRKVLERVFDIISQNYSKKNN